MLSKDLDLFHPVTKHFSTLPANIYDLYETYRVLDHLLYIYTQHTRLIFLMQVPFVTALLVVLPDKSFITRKMLLIRTVAMDIPTDFRYSDHNKDFKRNQRNVSAKPQPKQHEFWTGRKFSNKCSSLMLLMIQILTAARKTCLQCVDSSQNRNSLT